MYPELPKNEKSFSFDMTGVTTGRKYDGVFTVKCVLNMSEKQALELEKTRMLADYRNPTDTLFGLAAIMANLHARVKESPEWWKQSNRGADLLDEEVLVGLYDKVMACEAEWRKDLAEKQKGNVQTES